MNSSPVTSSSGPNSLSIGQIIYILSHKAQTVVPAVVVEEVTVKKINGNQVSWKVSIGPKDKNRIVDSTRIDGEIFTSLDEVRNVLLERFQQYVNNLVLETERRVEGWYGRQVANRLADLESPSQNGKLDPESFISSIEGNSASSNNHPSIPMGPAPRPLSTTRQELREQLKNRVMGGEDGTGSDDDDPNVSKQVVEMPGPDGKPILVSVKVPAI